MNMGLIKYKLLLFLRENIFKFDLPFMEERRNYFTIKEKKRFINYLNKFHPDLEVSLLEIGSLGGLCYNYEILKDLNNFHLEGIEPQEDEAIKEINSMKFPYKKIHNLAVSSSNGQKILYVTKSKGCTSLYKPNIDELIKLGEEDNFKITSEEMIKVKKLDSILKRDFDFINIDVQGSEYDIILGGLQTIKKCIGLSYEAHLFELYKGQRLFSHIHNLLHDTFRVLRFKTRTYKGVLFEIGDVCCIREMDSIDTEEKLLKHILYAVLWERKEYVQTLLDNKGSLLKGRRYESIQNFIKY